jgi:type I restriction-modification system DNA methylase subunit
MNHTVHNKNVSLIWSIADDCLRDIYVRGKYRDVILPMVVLRRLDSLLEPTKEKVLELMTRLVFEPVKDRLPVVMTIYDPACGSGGMLTESQNFIADK